MEVSRSGYYQYLKKEHKSKIEPDFEIVAKVRQIHADNRGSYGSRRMSGQLREEGYDVDRYRARSLMKKAGVSVKRRKKFKRTTDSNHNLPIAPNLLDRQFESNRPNAVWCAVPHYVDYVNGFDMSEAWRAVTSAKDFETSFSRGLTVVADFYVDEPILVTTSRKGPRYLTREEFLKKFEELIDNCYDLRVVAYDFNKHNFRTIMKGPFSLGVIAADLEIRQDDRFITLPKAAAVKEILNNVPQKAGPSANEKIRKLNQDVFESGSAARKQFVGSPDERIILI